jgi:hypothetical protein
LAQAPTPEEVRRIASIADPVIRNLRITDCYYRLSLAFLARTQPGANWCTFAVWASRQAGRTIRGEDFLAALEAHTHKGSVLLQPLQSIWRVLLRNGLLYPKTRLGRLVHHIHSPFDALERASDAVGRGNRKVFDEIGFEFARYLQSCPEDAASESEAFESFLRGLAPGDPPGGQEYLKRAFTRYQRQRLEPDSAVRAQMMFLGNLEIGFHEQNRLQPEIRESLESAPRTAEDLGMRALQAIYPGAWNWRAFVRRPLASLLAPAARSFSRFARELTCRVITDSIMTLALPGVSLALGRNLDRPPAAALATVSVPDLLELLDRIEPKAAPDLCGAGDWSNLQQRMHYIVHLFRAFQETSDLFGSPFTGDQVREIDDGVLPGGKL